MDEPARPWVLVTGGSSGIGFELARTFAEAGHNVLIAAYDIEKLEQAAELLRERVPEAEIDTAAADLASEEGVYALHREAMRKGRRIETLCANAGVGSGGGDFSETDLSKELELIDLNVRGQVQLTKLVLRDMLEAGGGRILITSSIAGIMPGPFEAVYAASKAFIRSFGEALRNELAEKNIGVTVFMPGPTDTDFFSRAGMADTPAGQFAKDDPAQVAEQAFAALMADKHAVVTGSLKTRLQGQVAKMLSDPARASIHRKQTEPFDRQAESGADSGGISNAALGGLFFVCAVAAAGTAVWLRSRGDPTRGETDPVVPRADFKVGVAPVSSRP